MTMKLWVKAASALGVVLIAVAVASVAALKSMDFNAFKVDVEKRIEDATGRKVTIAGDLKLSISLSPSLNVSGVTLSNATWGDKRPMMVMKNLQAKINVLSLLSGRIDVESLVLDGLTLVLQSDGKGRANWEFESGAAQASSSLGALTFTPRVRDVRLRNVDLTYIDGASGGRFQVFLRTVDLQAESFTSPMTAVIDAAYKGINVHARAKLGSLQLLVGTEGGSFPVDLNVQAPGVTVTVTGGVDQPQAGMAVKARVQVTVTDMTTLAALAGMDMPKVKRLQAQVNIAGAGPEYDFSALEVKAGNSDLAGRMKLNMSAKRPRLTGRLTANVLDIDQLTGEGIPTSGGKRSSPPQGSQIAQEEPLFTNDPLPIKALYGADLDVALTAKTVKVRSLNLSAVRARIKLEAGRFELSGLQMALDEGRLDGGMVLNGRGKVPSVSAHVKVRGLDLGTVLAAVGQRGVLTLKVNGDLNVTASGPSVQAMMGGLNGQVSFSGHNGRIKDASLQNVSTGLGSILPWAGKVDAGLIRCVVGRWPVKHGIATAETVLMDTPNIAVRVTGNVDLGGERLHLTVIPKAKTASLASFAVPVRIKGSFRAPHVSVNPEDALVGTVVNIVKAPVSILADILGGNGSASANDPCLKGPGGVKTSPHKKRAVPSPTKPNAVEKLSNTLKGLFGQ